MDGWMDGWMDGAGEEGKGALRGRSRRQPAARLAPQAGWVRGDGDDDGGDDDGGGGGGAAAAADDDDACCGFVGPRSLRGLWVRCGVVSKAEAQRAPVRGSGRRSPAGMARTGRRTEEPTWTCPARSHGGQLWPV
eukprot:scaffold3365_cov358-Prasinococcus_capsulatus_cf.AAC.5